MATVFEVRDEIWEVVEPMIPPVRLPERQGRRPVADRVCFEAIVLVMIHGDRVGPSAQRGAQRGRDDRLVRGGLSRAAIFVLLKGGL